ncbi:MAG: hypothetical protein ACXVZV_02745 [Terriglobales bacterium]
MVALDLHRKYSLARASPVSAQPQRGSAIVTTVLYATCVFLLAVGVLWFLDDSDRSTTNPQNPSVQTAVNATVHQLLATDPTDPLVAADVTTVRAFRDALERELAATDARLATTAGQQQEIKRRFVLQKMLTNAGRSGLNDRLAEVEVAIKLQGSALRLLPRNRDAIQRAIENIHTTAQSCRSGALKQAAGSLGLPES